MRNPKIQPYLPCKGVFIIMLFGYTSWCHCPDLCSCTALGQSFTGLQGCWEQLGWFAAGCVSFCYWVKSPGAWIRRDESFVPLGASASCCPTAPCPVLHGQQRVFDFNLCPFWGAREWWVLMLLAEALLLESLFAFLVPSGETDLRRAFC